MSASVATTRPTINDVARQAGVSKATVSAVLNDTGTVRESTRDRVLHVIEVLNYRPSGTGMRPGTPRSRSIGLLIKEIDNPYYAEIIASARQQANRLGYTLVAASSEGEYDSERRIVDLLKSHDVDGLIITPVLDRDTDLSHLFDLKRRNFPFVLLEEIRGVQASLIDIDNAEAMRNAVRYLIGQGHTRIVHFAGPPYSMHSEQRIAGVRRAFSESSLILTDEHIVPAGAHAEDGHRAGLAFFGGRPARDRPTAVVCYNDLLALGLMRALTELGLRVPEDVSVVGFDDLDLLRYLPVPLTSVRVPKRTMGEMAVQMVVRHIEASETPPPRKVFLEAELVVRGSTRSLLEDAVQPATADRPREGSPRPGGTKGKTP